MFGEIFYNRCLLIISRCLLILQWHVLGRITELEDVKFEQLEYIRMPVGKLSYLVINDFFRSKTGTRQNLALFVHKSNWRLCPLNAIATVIIICHSFPHLFKDMLRHSSSMSGHMNMILAKVDLESVENLGLDASMVTALEKLTENLTSHSVRSGSLNYCNYNENLSIIWLILRAGFSMDSIVTLFNYIAGNHQTDTPVARVLSAWPVPNEGGFLPEINCLPVEDHETKFEKLVSTLMSSAQLKKDCAAMLTLVLIKDFDDYDEDSIIRKAILHAAQLHDISNEKLLEWSATIKNTFFMLNAKYLTPTQNESKYQ